MLSRLDRVLVSVGAASTSTLASAPKTLHLCLIGQRAKWQFSIAGVWMMNRLMLLKKRSRFHWLIETSGGRGGVCPCKHCWQTLPGDIYWSRRSIWLIRTFGLEHLLRRCDLALSQSTPSPSNWMHSHYNNALGDAQGQMGHAPLRRRQFEKLSY